MIKHSFLFVLAVTSVLFSVFIPKTALSKSADSCFNAEKSCPAFQSFRKRTNPGDVSLKEGKTYSIIEKSKKGTYYRVRVEGLKKSARWVASDCGKITSSCSSATKRKSNLKGKPKLKQYLLALSWEPTFCEKHPSKKECRTLTDNRYDASNLSLHGLWPQPRGNAYCGVSSIDKGIDRNKRWHLLPPLKLSKGTISKLAFVMPGYASHLHRHEWIKHGTCYGTDADTYYAHSISLTEQINQSGVGKLLSNNKGKSITLKQLRKSFDKSFGKGAGKKIDLRCDRKGRISEVWINLKGSIHNKKANELNLSSLLKPALNAGSTCYKGVVDTVD